jgi:hypothetical protein
VDVIGPPGMVPLGFDPMLGETLGETPPPDDLDGLQDRLRAQVADRRAAGAYPADLEARLGSHFDRIRRLRDTEDHLEPVRLAVAELERRSQFTLAHNVSSRNALGERYHRAVADSIGRQVEPLVGQIRAYAEQLREVFATLVDRLDDPGSHVHADLLGQIDAALDRLGELHAMPADPSPGLSTTRGAPSAPGTPVPTAWLDPAELETFLRGTPAEIRARYAGLVEMLALASPVLEVHAGRGELLGLLAERGVAVQGCETQSGLVDAARSSGVPVDAGDSLAALAGVADSSLGAVILLRPLSHLGHLADLVALAGIKLRPGGALVVSGPDPDASDALARRMRADPEGRAGIRPETVEHLCAQASLDPVERYALFPTGWATADDSAEPGPLFAVVARR